MHHFVIYLNDYQPSGIKSLRQIQIRINYAPYKYKVKLFKKASHVCFVVTLDNNVAHSVMNVNFFWIPTATSKIVALRCNRSTTFNKYQVVKVSPGGSCKGARAREL